MAGPRIYNGTVVHTRMRPVQHRLRYSVFSILLDCNDLDAADRASWLFSVNKPNLISFHEKDHGEGGRLLPHLQGLARSAGIGERVKRFEMLCYPRIFGYAFNPITVYYGYDADDKIALLAYEVHNTFGEELTYVLPTAEGQSDGPIHQSCEKSFYVSPFNRVEGRYNFRVTTPGEDISIGVALETDGEPLLNASFAGTAVPLTTGNLLRAIARTGWMTLKVTVGIHVEAAKLWLKGLRVAQKPEAAKKDFIYPKG